MQIKEHDALRFPIGRFLRPEAYDPAVVARAIASIDGLPRRLLALVEGLRKQDWQSRYRAGGWSVRQIVHHIGDANINNYTRFKFALTEDCPTIKPYLENRWSDLPDVGSGDMGPTLDTIHAIHSKWTQVLKSMGEADFGRCFHHPDMQRDIPLYEAAAMYAWHGEHHLGHVQRALEAPVI